MYITLKFEINESFLSEFLLSCVYADVTSNPKRRHNRQQTNRKTTDKKPTLRKINSSKNIDIRIEHPKTIFYICQILTSIILQVYESNFWRIHQKT